MVGMIRLLDKLHGEKILERSELVRLVSAHDAGLREYAASLARRTALEHFGDRIFIRGLIEFTNFCVNDCLYCGIRRGNSRASRYRLDPETILQCCAEGHRLGFRTFVLQGGEDAYYNDDLMASIVSAIRAAYPDCAITLSVGEKSRETYERFFRAGADRYLLRHETADPQHYAMLHPSSLSLENREKCLWDLKAAGFQTGCGFMTGSPFQTPENLADDLLFVRRLEPEMVGVGPFIPHHDTPFASFPAGDVDTTLFMISLIRLLLPRALVPATTALGTMDPEGREKGVLAGANVVMPNLSPPGVREKYLLYDNKLATGLEAAEHVAELRRRMSQIGYRIVEERGDFS